MFRLGLKLHSTNKNYVAPAKKFFSSGVFDYVELSIVPDSYESYGAMWKDFDVPYVIHAPHFGKGMNLAQRECKKQNIKMAEETIKFANALHAETIIFHGGTDGNIEETIGQLRDICDERIVIENKPRLSLYNNCVCVGHTPQEIFHIMSEAGVGFCLDVGHAFFAANSLQRNLFDYFQEFLSLRPKLIHLNDGLTNSLYDQHLPFGKGNFDIRRVLQCLPSEASITIETEKNETYALRDFEQDVRYLEELMLQTVPSYNL